MDSCQIDAILNDLNKGVIKITCIKTGAHLQHSFEVVNDKDTQEEVTHKNIFEN